MLKRVKKRVLLHEGGTPRRCKHRLVTAAAKVQMPRAAAVGAIMRRGQGRRQLMIHRMVPEILGCELHGMGCEFLRRQQ